MTHAAVHDPGTFKVPGDVFRCEVLGTFARHNTLFPEKSSQIHGNLQELGLDNAKKLLYIESAFRKRFHNINIGWIESLPQVPQFDRPTFLQLVKALKVFSKHLLA